MEVISRIFIRFICDRKRLSCHFSLPPCMADLWNVLSTYLMTLRMRMSRFISYKFCSDLKLIPCYSDIVWNLFLVGMLGMSPSAIDRNNIKWSMITIPENTMIISTDDSIYVFICLLSCNMRANCPDCISASIQLHTSHHITSHLGE